MGFIMENKMEFDTCPICGSRDALVTELSDGTKVRTCRDISCPMYYIPVSLKFSVKKCLKIVGYELRSECGNAYFLVKNDEGFLLPKAKIEEEEKE